MINKLYKKVSCIYIMEIEKDLWSCTIEWISGSFDNWLQHARGVRECKKIILKNYELSPYYKQNDIIVLKESDFI